MPTLNVKHMDDKTLQVLVEKISVEAFQQLFKHRAYFNKRLRTTGGRYHLGSHNIDFNHKIIERYDENELIRVIKHELCHYHLHIANKGYRHQDRDFKKLLKETGGSRYVKPLGDLSSNTYKVYRCNKCNALVHRKRRIDTQKYVCGKCHGRLIEKKKDAE